MMEKYTKLRCDTFLVIVLTSLAFCCVFSAGNSKVGQNKKKTFIKGICKILSASGLLQSVFSLTEEILRVQKNDKDCEKEKE